DRAVVGDVVAAVGQRRRVPGVDPDGVDAEPGEVVELAAQAGDVAGAVTVPVGEAADVHLVDDGVAPPVEVVGAHVSYCSTLLQRLSSAAQNVPVTDEPLPEVVRRAGVRRVAELAG